MFFIIVLNHAISSTCELLYAVFVIKSKRDVSYISNLIYPIFAYVMRRL